MKHKAMGVRMRKRALIAAEALKAMEAWAMEPNPLALVRVKLAALAWNRYLEETAEERRQQWREAKRIP